jgi:tetratricopeptide (TPR) repeat protein
MNTRTTLRSVAALAALVAAGVGGRVAVAREAPSMIAAPAPAFAEQLVERNTQIRVWHQALDADSVSAIALGQLAALHLQRAREAGNWNDYLEAERFARRSVALRTNRNGSAAATLANILLAQHRFTEAQYVAAQLVRREGDIPVYRALLGEVSMEVGDYATTRRMYDSLWSSRASLSIAPRLARWAELNGHVRTAQRLLDSALAIARSRRDVPKETKAWFEMRAGELAMRAGKPRTARARFNAGLAIEPNDPRLLAAMARLALSQGNAREAIAFGDRAIGVLLDPDMLGVVSDAYAMLGNAAKSDEYLDAMEAAVTGQSGPFHRAWSMHLLDHGRRIDDVLKRAQDEYAGRKDIYGADLLAWALHKTGRDDDADAPMRVALQLGTPDAVLWYHDGVIARACGDVARARRSFARALEINPHFDVAGVGESRAALKAMGG